MDQKTLQLLHDTKLYLDRLKEVLDLFLCSYYFSYFAFNLNKRGKPIYLLYSFILMLIIFTFKFIIMLICYVTMKLS